MISLNGVFVSGLFCVVGALQARPAMYTFAALGSSGIRLLKLLRCWYDYFVMESHIKQRHKTIIITCSKQNVCGIIHHQADNRQSTIIVV